MRHTRSSQFLTLSKGERCGAILDLPETMVVWSDHKKIKATMPIGYENGW